MSIAQNFPEIRPSLNLDFANVKALDSRVTFARASTGAYYDGQTVAKAEENLLLNSVFSGAVAGTPGTTPTNFTFAASGGSIDSVTLGADGVSNVLTLSATAARQIFDRSIAVSASTVYQAQITLISNANSITIAQLLTWISPPAGSTVAYFINGSAALGTDVPSANALIVAQLTVSVTAGTATYRFGIGTGGVATGTAAFTRPQLEQRSAVTAYTPTTTQPITNYIPVLQTASANVARFDHNPVTGESLGLLVEEQRTNLFQRSEEFDNAYWQKIRTSITANTIIAPDGALTGDKLVENTDTNSHFLAKVETTTNTNPLTWSVYAKAGERPNLSFAVREATTFTRNASALFDLSAGTVGAVSTAGGTSAASATITAVGNGWYRCTLTCTLGGTDTNSQVLWQLNNGVATSYTGDGYSGIFIWGAQLEAGSFPTSYIPTVASQVTRSADSASMTGANFSDWYRQDEGTVYVEAQAPEATLGYVFHLFSQVGTNRYFLTKVSTTSMRFTVFNGATLASLNKTIDAESIKYAVGIELDNYALVKDGDTPVLDTSALILTPDTLQIGANTASAAHINGHIRKLSYYPQRLTDTQLQAITG